MIKVVNTGLIDWFNEFYGERYCSLIFPQRGIFSTLIMKAKQ